MFTERWDEIKEKLLAALDLEPAERSAYLARIGELDPELEKELNSLVASHEQTGTDFLDVQLARVSSVLPSREESHSLLDQRLGPYKVVERIGVGGMGEVYRAFRADDQYLRKSQSRWFVAARIRKVSSNDSRMNGRFWLVSIIPISRGYSTEELLKKAHPFL